VCLSLISSCMLIVALTVTFINGLNLSKHEAELARDEAEKARDISERARDTAELNHRRAEYDQKRYFDMLQALKKERSAPVKRESDHKDPFSMSMFSYIHPPAYDNPQQVLNPLLEKLDSAVRTRPDDKELYVKRGFVRFVIQDFKGAYKDFSVQCDDWFYRRIMKVCLQHKDVPYNVQNVLPANTLIDVIYDLSDNVAFNKVMMLLLKYDAVVRKSLSDHSRIVRAVLKVLNPEWRQKSFSFNAANHSLELTGKGLFRLGIYQLDRSLEKRVSAVSTLRLKRLSVVGTDLVDIDTLFEDELEELDMRRTLVRYIGDLKGLPSIKRVIVSPDQVEERQLHGASQRVEVIVK